MKITNVTDDYDYMILTNFSNTEIEDIKIIFEFLLLSIPSSILLFSLIVLMVSILIKSLLSKKQLKGFKKYCFISMYCHCDICDKAFMKNLQIIILNPDSINP